MVVREALGRPAAPRGSPAGSRELALALPSLDDVKVEAEAALRAVSVAERAELFGVGIHPPAVTIEEVCDVGGSQDALWMWPLSANDATLCEHIRESLGDRAKVVER
jgi:hypothetical protein